MMHLVHLLQNQTWKCTKPPCPFIVGHTTATHTHTHTHTHKQFPNDCHIFFVSSYYLPLSQSYTQLKTNTLRARVEVLLCSDLWSSWLPVALTSVRPCELSIFCIPFHSGFLFWSVVCISPSVYWSHYASPCLCPSFLICTLIYMLLFLVVSTNFCLQVSTAL